MSSFDLSKFKKVSETAHAAILKHPDGHKITIAKKVLSPKMNEQLKKLPMHFDVGGGVPYDQQPLPPPPEPQPDRYGNSAFTDGTFDFNKFALNNPDVPVETKLGITDKLAADEASLAKKEQAASEEKALQAKDEYEKATRYNQIAAQRGLQPVPVPGNPDITQAVASTENTVPDAGKSALETSPLTQSKIQQPAQAMPQNLATQGYNEQRSGIGEEAKATGAMADQQAAAYQKSINEQQQLMADYQQKHAEQMGEIKSVMEDIKNTHIDPSRLMAHQDTMGKIGTAIGLFLGGMGGGGHGNMALDYLNKIIDRDVDAQKTDLQTKNNLLNANYNNLNSLDAATNMTRAMHFEIAKNEIEKITAKNQNPILQARAKQLYGQLDQAQGALLHTNTMNQLLASGQMPARAAGYLTPQQRETAVELPNGMLGQAPSKEDAEKARNSFLTYKDIENQIDEMEAFQKEHGVTAPTSTANALGTAMQDRLIQSIQSMEQYKRFSPELLKHLEDQVGHPGAVRQDITSAKLQSLRADIARKKAQDMNAYTMGGQKAPEAAPSKPNFQKPNMKMIAKK